MELLSIGTFSDAPRTRAKTRLIGVGSSHEPDGTGEDEKKVWPFTISFIGQGQLGGQYTLWCDSYVHRAEWHEKLNHAKVLRTEVNDANKVFEMTPLSMDTFFMAPNYSAPSRDGDSQLTGRVTCSVPFGESSWTYGLAGAHSSHGRPTIARRCGLRRGRLDRFETRREIATQGLAYEGCDEYCCAVRVWHIPRTARQGELSDVRVSMLTPRPY